LTPAGHSHSDGAGEDALAVRERLLQVRSRIAAACARVGRSPEEVVLVGVSKGQPPERIALSVRAGLTHLGESYVQELQQKRPRVESAIGEEAAARLRWHLVGGLQRNKVRAVLPLVDAVQSVDRESLAVELERQAGASGRVLDVYLQVNVSGEAQKGGVPPEGALALLTTCAGLSHLRVVGLMAVPTAEDDPELARPAFAQLRALRDTLRGTPWGQALRELSMGMSADFEIAIEEGASVVRVGTALFGPRAGH
jgi:hypothetical protein